jgi:aspartate 1-decarboxylase
MLKCILNAKIHRAVITQTDLYYVGSITIDRDLMDAVGLIAYDKVEVFDIQNGNRFETYVIEGERGSGVIGVNGAAARLVHIGDEVIIVSYVWLDEKELQTHKPKIISIDKSNKSFTREP